MEIYTKREFEILSDVTNLESSYALDDCINLYLNDEDKVDSNFIDLRDNIKKEDLEGVIAITGNYGNRTRTYFFTLDGEDITEKISGYDVTYTGCTLTTNILLFKNNKIEVVFNTDANPRSTLPDIVFKAGKKNLDIIEMLYNGEFKPMEGSLFSLLYTKDEDFLWHGGNWEKLASSKYGMSSYGINECDDDEIELKTDFTKEELDKIYNTYKENYGKYKVEDLFYISHSDKLEQVWDRIQEESDFKEVEINIPYIVE